MIQFSLKCSEDHSFDSWFQSSDAFEKLKKSGMVTCPMCGTHEVEKAIMAPRVRPSRSGAAPTDAEPPELPAETMHALTAPSSPAEAVLAELKQKIKDNSEYVGNNFAKEARKIHDGDAPERSIYGEAKAEDAKKLIEDGVPVAPLPFVPTRKQN